MICCHLNNITAKLQFFSVDISAFGIESPVDVAKLGVYIKGYSDEQFIVDGFKNGFSLGVKSDYCLPYGRVKP